MPYWRQTAEDFYDGSLRDASDVVGGVTFTLVDEAGTERKISIEVVDLSDLFEV